MTCLQRIGSARNVEIFFVFFHCYTNLTSTAVNRSDTIQRVGVQSPGKCLFQRSAHFFFWFRYALSFLNVGPTLRNESYVKGNSFNHNLNTALGIFGTSNLLVEDNVVYFTIEASIKVRGEANEIRHNLVVYTASYSTYKDRRDRFDIHWPGTIETISSIGTILIDNAVGKRNENKSPQMAYRATIHPELYTSRRSIQGFSRTFKTL